MGGEFEVGNTELLSCGRLRNGCAGAIAGMVGGCSVGMLPDPRSSFHESGRAPDISGGQTCELGRERLSLDSSRRCRAGREAAPGVRLRSERRGVPREREAAEQLQVQDSSFPPPPAGAAEETAGGGATAAEFAN